MMGKWSPCICSAVQELSERAVDARLRRLCEVKAKSRRANVEPWIQDEYKDLDKRDALRLSLVEALKECGISSDAETRKRVKARCTGVKKIGWVVRSSMKHRGQVYPPGDHTNPGEAAGDQRGLVH